MNDEIKVVIWNPDGDGGHLLLRNPSAVLEAKKTSEIIPVLNEVESAAVSGARAAGFISYEAGPGLDGALEAHDLRDFPLAWFAVFEDAQEIDIEGYGSAESFRVGDWTPSVGRPEYCDAISRIKDYLRRGHTYQVNYTLRLRAEFAGDAWSFFRRLQHNQLGSYGAFIDMGRFSVCSASPELFFSLIDRRLESRPMKGTASRGLTWEDDERRMRDLHNSEKDRAENVMIVDMIRNDMGRVAESGSVRAVSLFDTERYPTVHQMTSTVVCSTSAGFTDIMQALFPCASITGAPKVRTMQIIRDLEPDPRGIYTGSIGIVGPGRRARFSVAIRTVCVDREKGTAEYGVGGGVVWDSEPSKEYEECLTKAGILTAGTPGFDLLESVLWEPGTGYFLLDNHLRRLRNSAGYFGREIDLPGIRETMLSRARGLEGAHKVRLLVPASGEPVVECVPLSNDRPEVAVRVVLARRPVNRHDAFLYHKTTHRAVYEEARKSEPDFDDVILWNDRQEATESTVANLVVEKEGRLVTPPVECGLLPGVFREHLIESGAVAEEVVSIEDLRRADRLFLVNSVRKWMEAELREQADCGSLSEEDPAYGMRDLRQGEGDKD
ncbi:MAG: aminodeoxychorismate synthase component I [Kiritimatiellia bacterium]